MPKNLSLRDFFASKVQVTQKEILDYLEVNQTDCNRSGLAERIDAEASIRFLKADSMLVARKLKI